MARKNRTAQPFSPGLTRLSLPGQDPSREAELLAKYTAYFKPDLLEELTVEAIAYCAVSVEYYKAILGAFMARCMRESHAALKGTDFDFEDDAFGLGLGSAELSDRERLLLQRYEAMAFTPAPGMSNLAEPAFARILGQLSREQVDMVQLLQANLHREQKEYHRNIYQIDRRRREAFRHAQERAHAEIAQRAAEEQALIAARRDAPTQAGAVRDSHTKLGQDKAPIADQIDAAPLPVLADLTVPSALGAGLDDAQLDDADLGDPAGDPYGDTCEEAA